jgi:hypothetical protein
MLKMATTNRMNVPMVVAAAMDAMLMMIGCGCGGGVAFVR